MNPILLIDDSQEDTFLFRRQLTRAGVVNPIVAMANADEAFAYLRACVQNPIAALTPAVVFCDIRMPGRSGFEVLEWVRQQKTLSQLPFYILSGADLQDDRAMAVSLGATAYLVKFPSTGVLLATVRAILPGRDRDRRR